MYSRASVFYKSMTIVFSLSCFFCFTTFASGGIARNDLRLELMLATGTLDTSGTNRIVTTSGSVLTFQTDSTYGIPFGKFTGSGWLRVNTGWSTTGDNLTISFWIRHSGSFLTGATSLTWSVKDILFDNGMTYQTHTDTEAYSSPLGQDIFTAWENGEIKMILDASGKCSIRWWNAVISSSFPVGRVNKYGAYTWGTYSLAKIMDTGTNLQENFNCSSLLNNKWHSVVLLSSNWTTSIYIDGVESTRYGWSAKISRYISIGFSDSNYYNSFSGKFLTGQINLITDSKFLQWSIAAFRLYSRALNNDELEALFDEFRYAQSDLAGAWNIQVSMERYAKPILYSTFKNIPISLSKESVTYQYSTDGQNFYPITDITDLSIWTWSLDYRMAVDLSGKPDGKITIIYRVQANDWSFQNLWTISFIKMDLSTGISIHMPSAEPSSSKMITADAPGAEVKMYISPSGVCDATIGTGSFEDYSDLIFTKKEDNGKRVCYRAFYPSINKIVYRLTWPITGIQPADAYITNIFDDYTSWPSGGKPKPNDSALLVLTMLGYNTTNTLGTAANGVTLTDINGDGLVDFLYSKNDLPRRAIIVNNGNYTFKVVYKCALDPAGNNLTSGSNAWFPSTTYYGDCTDTSR